MWATRKGRWPVLASALAALLLLAPAAVAEEGGSDGSETTGQEVSVSEGDNSSGSSSSSSESSGSGSSCSGSSQVTVVTDKGTEHPSSGGTCSQAPEPQPVAEVQDTSDFSPGSRTEATPAATVDPFATSAPVIAQATPYVSVVSEAPRAARKTGGGGLGIPFALILLALALAGAAYLVFSAVRTAFARITGRSLDTGVVPYSIEDEWSVRVLQRATNGAGEPIPPAPTQEIDIEADDGRVWVELMTVPDDRETATEADILTTGEPARP